MSNNLSLEQRNLLWERIAPLLELVPGTDHRYEWKRRDGTHFRGVAETEVPVGNLWNATTLSLVLSMSDLYVTAANVRKSLKDHKVSLYRPKKPKKVTVPAEDHDGFSFVGEARAVRAALAELSSKVDTLINMQIAAHNDWKVSGKV